MVIEVQHPTATPDHPYYSCYFVRELRQTEGADYHTVAAEGNSYGGRSGAI